MADPASAAASTTPAKKPISKTKFVLSLPRDLAVGEVVARAKAAGITISEGYVSNIRSVAKGARKAKRNAKKAAKGAPVKAVAPAKKSSKPAGKKRGRPKKSAAAPAAKPASPKGAGGGKRAFIETMPNAPVKEVIAAAKKAGISLSENYVYVIRRGGHKAKKGGKRGRKAAVAAIAKSVTPSANGGAPRVGTAEARFVDLVVEIGLGRADALLGQVRSKLRSITVG